MISRVFSHTRTPLKKMIPNIMVWCVAIFSQSQPTIIWSPELNSPSQPPTSQGEGSQPFFFLIIYRSYLFLTLSSFLVYSSILSTFIKHAFIGFHYIPGPVLGSGHIAVLRLRLASGDFNTYIRHIPLFLLSLELDTQLKWS